MEYFLKNKDTFCFVLQIYSYLCNTEKEING